MTLSERNPVSQINVPLGCTIRYAASERLVAPTSSFLRPKSGIGSAILSVPQSNTYNRTVCGAGGRDCAPASPIKSAAIAVRIGFSFLRCTFGRCTFGSSAATVLIFDDDWVPWLRLFNHPVV